jgi:hypothetical protein
MNIRNLFVKKVTAPQSSAVKTVDAVQLWTVRWLSRYNEYAGSVREEVEAFTSEQDARDFKLALENAFKLLKHTSGTTVTITKEK